MVSWLGFAVQGFADFKVVKLQQRMGRGAAVKLQWIDWSCKGSLSGLQVGIGRGWWQILQKGERCTVCQEYFFFLAESLS